MKRQFLTLFMAFYCVGLLSQPLGPAYVVYFTDKNNSPYSINNPSEFLTQEAINRRVNQGILINMDDIPVNNTYLNAIADLGAQIAAVSRWFNTAAVWIHESSVVDAIVALPFVSSVEPMGSQGALARDNEKWKIKPFFEFDGYDNFVITQEAKTVATNYFDYGQGLHQLAMINGVSLHNQGYRGQGMTVALLDAGYRHVDINRAFDSLRANNRILGTRDFVQPGNNVYSSGIHPHGANVLSIMASNIPGEMVGSAPEASYWLLRTEDANGPPGNSEYLMEEYFWVAGAEFADSVGAWVINSSLGYSTFDDPSQNHTYADMDGNTTPVTRGANFAASKGILVVNSAGNSGGGPWQYIIAPADGFHVLAVGAVNYDGDYVSWSSTGPSYDGRVKPDVTAMGAGTILVDPNGFVTPGNGTSYSSPIIAGMVTCLWQSNMVASNNEVYQSIIQSASQYFVPDNFKGYGIPDFYEAQFILTTDTSIGNQTGLIKAYPNPASHYIIIDVQQADVQIRQLKISDISGRILKELNYSTSSQAVVYEDVSFLKAGIYMFTIVTNKSTETIKILKD